jgi:hypothetical protein
MALSNSERQRRYRERWLGAQGKYERINCLVSISSKRNLNWLASHFDSTIAGIIEHLVNEKIKITLSQLGTEKVRRLRTRSSKITD